MCFPCLFPEPLLQNTFIFRKYAYGTYLGFWWAATLVLPFSAKWHSILVEEFVRGTVPVSTLGSTTPQTVPHLISYRFLNIWDAFSMVFNKNKKCTLDRNHLTVIIRNAWWQECRIAALKRERERERKREKNVFYLIYTLCNMFVTYIIAIYFMYIALDRCIYII